MAGLLDTFSAGNPFLGTKLLEVSIGRDFGARKGQNWGIGLGGGLNDFSTGHPCFLQIYLKLV